MQTDGEGKMAAIKDQIERGDYRVDPRAVADAILRRIELSWDWGPLRLDDPYSKCSYPERSSRASTNATPASPEATHPITVRSANARRPSAGPHTQSS